MSTTDLSNAELIAAYLDAVMRKDPSVVDRFFDPNVEYMVNGSPEPDAAHVLPPISADCRAALPWAGLHQGRDAVKKFLAHMHSNLEVTTFGPREVILQENKGAAFGWFRLRSLSTGRTADISYSIFFEISNDLVRKYHFLENTFDVARAFYEGGSWVINTDGVNHTIPLSKSSGEDDDK